MGEKGKKNGSSPLLVVAVFILLLVALGSCGGSSSDDSYKETLNNGLEKYYNGDEMTKEEYDAVKSYNNWKYKNSDHDYDSWDDNGY